jgi:hypothetical protein
MINYLFFYHYDVDYYDFKTNQLEHYVCNYDKYSIPFISYERLCYVNVKGQLECRRLWDLRQYSLMENFYKKYINVYIQDELIYGSNYGEIDDILNLISSDEGRFRIINSYPSILEKELDRVLKIYDGKIYVRKDEILVIYDSKTRMEVGRIENIDLYDLEIYADKIYLNNFDNEVHTIQVYDLKTLEYIKTLITSSNINLLKIYQHYLLIDLFEDVHTLYVYDLLDGGCEIIEYDSSEVAAITID